MTETETESPAALLRRAAAKVRDVGEAARARGPYFVEGNCVCDDDEDWTGWCADRTNHRHSSWQVRTEVPHDPTIISYEVVDTNCEDDAQWLALMSPVVAAPLAAWLESAAAVLDDYPGFADPSGNFTRLALYGDQSPAFRHSYALVRDGLAMARVLLGEGPS